MAERLTFSTYPPINQSSSKRIPLVLIHGWGLNSGVWQPLLETFNKHHHNFQLITIDLPGFGKNSSVEIAPYNLHNICHLLAQTISQPAIYLGWSLGGLITTQMSLSYPEKVRALISVASSPFFVEQPSNNWPGIKPNVLKSFHQQLSQDTAKTITNFLKIQAMGSPHIRQDLKQITQLVMAHPLPSQKALTESLTLLSQCDLREKLIEIKKPFLRLYGQNDSLVPKALIEQVNQIAMTSEYYSFKQASHAPFISHLDEFYQILINWLNLKFGQE